MALGIVWLLVSSADYASADVFGACIRTSTGRVRGSSITLGTPACKEGKETAVAWNDVGPEGPEGPAGPEGPVGPSMAFSTSQLVGEDLPIPVPFAGVDVAQLDLPAGAYVVTASLYLTNDAVTDGIALCILVLGDENAIVIDTQAPHQAVSQALSVAAQLDAPGTATLSCNNNGIGGNLAIQTYNLNAVQVDTIDVQ
jgi:hypothetical protein